MSAVLAGLPHSVPANTINRLCGSSLDAIIQASRAIWSGDAELIIAGGVESMSRAPYSIAKNHATSFGNLTTNERDYSLGDLIVLWPLGVAAAMCSVVVFGLFISAPETQARYANPELLWLVAVGLIYWLSRLWIKTARKQMHDDPLVFALRDRGSRVTMAAMIITTLAAHYLRIA